MSLAKYIVNIRPDAVLVHLLAICRLFAFVLLVPGMVAALDRDWLRAAVFAALAALLLVSGWLSRRLSPREIDMREALVVTALSYLLFAAIGAVAFGTVLPPMDALFESMSGITTTGLSVVDPANLPLSLVFLRAYSQWLGGAGIVILSLAVVFGTGKTALSLFQHELPTSDIIGNVRNTARVVAAIYLALSVLAVAVFLAAGMTPGDAIMHAMATVSTGGFSPHGDSIGAYSSVAVAVVAIPLMVLGATSVPLMYRLRTEGPSVLLREQQLRYMVVLLVAGTAVFALAGSAGMNSAFHAASALSTTGFNITAPASWTPMEQVITIMLMIIGGCSASTAGGIKLWRLALSVRTMALMLVRVSLPDEAEVPLPGRAGKALDVHEERTLMGFLALYIVILVLSSLALMAGGAAPVAALFESASALGTVGLSMGITSPDLAPWLKAVLIFDMWAGRLEILPVLLVFYIRTWKGHPQ